jgi:O-antigen/teichoic acid export membrane protein
MLVSFLNFIPSTTAQVLFAEVGREPEALRHHLKRSLQGVYVVLLPCLVVILIAGPLLLSVFGPDYREGASTAIRLLALSSVFTGGTYLVDALLAASDFVKAYILMNIVNAVFVIAGVASVVDRGLNWAAGAWSAAQAASLVFGVVMLVILRGHRRRTAAHGPEDLVDVLERLANDQAHTLETYS